MSVDIEPRFFVSLLLAVSGLISVLVSVITIVRGGRTWSWKPTPGYIIDVNILEINGVEDDYITYYLKPNYEYDAHGRRYANNVVQIGGGRRHRYRNRRDAERARGRLLRKPEIRVYYNPNKPKQSVLIPGTTWAFAVPSLLVGLLLMFMGIVRLSEAIPPGCYDIEVLCWLRDQVERM